jgi:hypothetical protein
MFQALAPLPETRCYRVSPHALPWPLSANLARSMFHCYNIASEDDLRPAAQKTTMYVDTLPTKRVSG